MNNIFRFKKRFFLIFGIVLFVFLFELIKVGIDKSSNLMDDNQLKFIHKIFNFYGLSHLNDRESFDKYLMSNGVDPSSIDDTDYLAIYNSACRYILLLGLPSNIDEVLPVTDFETEMVTVDKNDTFSIYMITINSV